jgi:1,2-diacylglycerol 3-alpha-glucosyltransferase
VQTRSTFVASDDSARGTPGEWGWPIARTSGSGPAARVGIFSDSYLPRISGVVRSIESFVGELRRQGHHASIFAPAYRGYIDTDRDVIRFPSVRAPGVPDFPLAIPVAARFIAKLRRRRLTVVHTHSPFMMGRAGEYAARRLRLPLIFTHHTMYSEYVHYVPILSQQFSRDVVTRYTVRYCNRCALVISPSFAVKSWLESIGVNKPIQVLATAGLELDRYDRLDPSWVRITYGIPSDAPLVITVGRLAREKRFDVLLAAFAEAGRGTSARLLIVGGGPQETELQTIAAQLAVRDQVVFSGPLPHTRVLECYAAADLFAFASPTETQGLVVVEAMAAGLPVIAVRAGGVVEVVHDGETGRLVALDTHALAGAIRQALHDPDFRRRCGAAGRRAAHAYAIETIVERLVMLYQRVSMQSPVVAAPD